VVQININGLTLPLESVKHEVVNVACGNTTSLIDLWQMIKTISGASSQATHGPTRKGDILFSLADISKAKELLAYKEQLNITEGLTRTIDWYKK
jgi:UDP-N-acetylglucosamine 4-epimerase